MLKILWSIPSWYVPVSMLSYNYSRGQTSVSNLIGGERMELDSMTQTELILWLETLADLIESKAQTVEDAVEIIREKAKKLK